MPHERQDRYVKAVLTVIAVALIYLCAVLTPWPPARAQGLTKPGEIAGPMEVVIVGWKAMPDRPIPVSAPQALAVTVQNSVRVAGRVETERSSGQADRVVLVGWEESGEAGATVRHFDPSSPSGGVPTSSVPR